MAKLGKADNAKLIEIVTATRSEAGCMTSTEATLKKLVAAGLVEIGGPVDGSEGEVYVRATEKGLAEIPVADNVPPVSNVAETSISENEGNMDENTQVAGNTDGGEAGKAKRTHVMVDASTISVGSGLPPTGKRGGGSGRKSVYPFAALAAPVRDAAGNAVSMSYFFVPAQPGRDDPARSLNATVSGYNKKAKEAGVDPATGLVPEYKVFKDAENGVDGAKVYRVQ